MKFKLLQAWNHEFASPTGALASLCHHVLSQKYIFKRTLPDIIQQGKMQV